MLLCSKTDQAQSFFPHSYLNSSPLSILLFKKQCQVLYSRWFHHKAAEWSKNWSYTYWDERWELYEVAGNVMLFLRPAQLNKGKKQWLPWVGCSADSRTMPLASAPNTTGFSQKLFLWEIFSISILCKMLRVSLFFAQQKQQCLLTKIRDSTQYLIINGTVRMAC